MIDPIQAQLRALVEQWREAAHQESIDRDPGWVGAESALLACAGELADELDALCASPLSQAEMSQDSDAEADDRYAEEENAREEAARATVGDVHAAAAPVAYAVRGSHRDRSFGDAAESVCATDPGGDERHRAGDRGPEVVAASPLVPAQPAQERLVKAARWAERQLGSLVADDDGNGAFVRGTGTELAGFGAGIDELRCALRESVCAAAVPLVSAQPELPMSPAVRKAMDRFHQRCAEVDAAAVPLVEARPQEERAWLVELQTAGSATARWWTGARWKGVMLFEPDANKAIRFARRCDAEQAIGWLVSEGTKDGITATEHIWMAGVVELQASARE